jgi:hypothetical protein
MGFLHLAVGDGSVPPLSSKGSREDGQDKQSELSKVRFSHEVNEENREGKNKCSLLERVSKVSKGGPVLAGLRVGTSASESTSII